MWKVGDRVKIKFAEDLIIWEWKIKRIFPKSGLVEVSNLCFPAIKKVNLNQLSCNFLSIHTAPGECLLLGDKFFKCHDCPRSDAAQNLDI